MSGSFDVKCEWFGSVLLTRTRRRSGWLEYGATVPAPRRQRNSSGVRRPGYSAGYRRPGGDRGRARRAPSGPRTWPPSPRRLPPSAASRPRGRVSTRSASSAGRLDAGARGVSEGILTRPRRPARIEEGAERGSAPVRFPPVPPTVSTLGWTGRPELRTWPSSSANLLAAPLRRVRPGRHRRGAGQVRPATVMVALDREAGDVAVRLRRSTATTPRGRPRAGPHRAGPARARPRAARRTVRPRRGPRARGAHRRGSAARQTAAATGSIPKPQPFGPASSSSTARRTGCARQRPTPPRRRSPSARRRPPAGSPRPPSV